MVDFATYFPIHATKIAFKIVHFTWKGSSLKVIHLQQLANVSVVSAISI